MKDKDARIAVLGGRGMLGTDIVRTCQQNGISVKAFDLPECDITDASRLKIAVRGKSVVINCAAYTDVDKAESEESLAHRINAEAVGQLGELAKKEGATVLHFSTDFVFDGTLDRPYVETDEPNPINAYGKTKLEGEKLLAASGCRHCIIRVEWTYGMHGNNFVRKLIESASVGTTFRIVNDQVGSPTATAEIAGAVCELLQRKEGLPEGIYHYAADGYISRYEMAEFIFNTRDLSVNLTSCRTSDYYSPAQRPLNSRFDCAKIAGLLRNPIRGWRGPLEYFLEQL